MFTWFWSIFSLGASYRHTNLTHSLNTNKQAFFGFYLLGEPDKHRFSTKLILTTKDKTWDWDGAKVSGSLLTKGKRANKKLTPPPRDRGGGDCSLDYRMIASYKVHRIKGTIDKDWFMRQVNRYQIDSWYSTILIKSFEKSKQTN